MSAVFRIMRMLNQEYPGKFEIGKKDPERPHEPTPRMRLWESALGEYPDEIILKAALHLVTTRTSEWPPILGQVREQCAKIAHGQLLNPNSHDAWEHVLKAVTAQARNEEFRYLLTDLEWAAVKKTGDGTLAGIGRSNIDVVSSNFIKIFDRLAAAQRLEWVTLPRVKQLVARNMPAFPAPLLEVEGDDKGEIPTPEEVQEFISQLATEKGIGR